MSLHFDIKEFRNRLNRLLELMAKNVLEGMLLFRQESMFYLTGYDTFGYVFFQCLYLGRDGKLILLTRAPDLRQARHTSIVEDIRIWVDGPVVNPALQLKNILQECGCTETTWSGIRLLRLDRQKWENFGLRSGWFLPVDRCLQSGESSAGREKSG